MGEFETPRKAYPYPSVNQTVDRGGTDIKELAEALDALNEGHVDFMKPGIVNRADWENLLLLEPEINTATGAVKPKGPAGGPAWIETEVKAQGALELALTRTLTAKKTWPSIVPSALPTPGKWLCCQWEIEPEAGPPPLAAWNRPVNLFAHSALQVSSLGAAINHPPTVGGGRVAVGNFVIHNEAGIYSASSPEPTAPLAQPLGPTAAGTVQKLYPPPEFNKLQTVPGPVYVVATVQLFTQSASEVHRTVTLKVDGKEAQKAVLQAPNEFIDTVSWGFECTGTWEVTTSGESELATPEAFYLWT